MKSPVKSAVRSTPAVESTNPGAMTGRIEAMRVDMPPEKRMTHRAIMPMNWASCILLNWSPRPSVPKWQAGAIARFTDKYSGNK